MSPSPATIGFIAKCGFLAAALLLAFALLEYLGVGTETATAQILAVENYHYSEKTGKHSTPKRRTGNRYTIRFNHEGEQIERKVEMRHYNYKVGRQIDLVFRKSPPHKVVKFGETRLPSMYFVVGFIVLICSGILWGSRNGIKPARDPLA